MKRSRRLGWTVLQLVIVTGSCLVAHAGNTEVFGPENGGGLTPAQQSALCCAIDLVPAGGVKDCLLAMKNSCGDWTSGSVGGFCVEENDKVNSDTNATTWPDSDCDGGEMNINPTYLVKPAPNTVNEEFKYLKTLLYHEGLHAVGGTDDWGGSKESEHWMIYRKQKKFGMACALNAVYTGYLCGREMDFCVPLPPITGPTPNLDNNFVYAPSGGGFGGGSGAGGGGTFAAYVGHPQGPTIKAYGQGYVVLGEYSSGMASVLDIEAFTRGGTRYLAACGMDATQTVGKVTVFESTDPDGIYDDALATPAFASGVSLDAIGAIAYDADNDRTFLMEARSRDIYVASGISNMTPVAFATAAAVPSLATARKILWNEEVGALITMEGNDEDPSGALTRLNDVDGDGVVESVQTYEPYQLLKTEPAIRRGAVGGSTHVKVKATHGTSLELWTYLPATSQLGQLLGATTIASEDRNEVINLASPLVAGQSLVLRKTASGDIGAPLEVVPAGPEVWSISPPWGTFHGGDLVQIRGYGLPATPTVTFGSVNAPVVSATSELIEVLTPAQTDDIDVRVTIQGTGGETTTVFVYTIDPPEGGSSVAARTLNLRLKSARIAVEKGVWQFKGALYFSTAATLQSFDPASTGARLEVWSPYGASRLVLQPGDPSWRIRRRVARWNGVAPDGTAWRIVFDQARHRFNVRIQSDTLPVPPDDEPVQFTLVLGEDVGVAAAPVRPGRGRTNKVLAVR